MSTGSVLNVTEGLCTGIYIQAETDNWENIQVKDHFFEKSFLSKIIFQAQSSETFMNCRQFMGVRLENPFAAPNLGTVLTIRNSTFHDQFVYFFFIFDLLFSYFSIFAPSKI